MPGFLLELRHKLLHPSAERRPLQTAMACRTAATKFTQHSPSACVGALHIGLVSKMQSSEICRRGDNDGLLWKQVHSLIENWLHTRVAIQLSWIQPCSNCWPICMDEKVIVEGSIQVSHCDQGQKSVVSLDLEGSKASAAVWHHSS